MRLSRFLYIFAAALLAAACNGQAQPTGGAVSQVQAQPSGAALREIDEAEVMIPSLNLTVEEVEEDADLYDQSGEEAGEIDAVLVDAGGRPAAIAATIATASGNDERTVVIGLDRLRADEDDDLVITLTPDEIQRLPDWDG